MMCSRRVLAWIWRWYFCQGSIAVSTTCSPIMSNTEAAKCKIYITRGAPRPGAQGNSPHQASPPTRPHTLTDRRTGYLIDLTKLGVSNPNTAGLEEQVGSVSLCGSSIPSRSPPAPEPRAAERSKAQTWGSTEQDSQHEQVRTRCGVQLKEKQSQLAHEWAARTDRKAFLDALKVKSQICRSES